MNDLVERTAKQIGFRMLTYRNRGGLSVKELSERTGISESNIYYWEKGRAIDTVKVPVLVANALGVSIETVSPQTLQTTQSVSQYMGLTIKRLRKEKGLSLNEIRRQTGLSSNTIRDWENGKRENAFRTVELTSRALDVPVGLFFNIGGER